MSDRRHPKFGVAVRDGDDGLYTYRIFRCPVSREPSSATTRAATPEEAERPGNEAIIVLKGNNRGTPAGDINGKCDFEVHRLRIVIALSLPTQRGRNLFASAITSVRAVTRWLGAGWRQLA
jgi:hypothetical protein